MNFLLYASLLWMNNNALVWYREADLTVRLSASLCLGWQFLTFCENNYSMSFYNSAEIHEFSMCSFSFWFWLLFNIACHKQMTVFFIFCTYWNDESLMMFQNFSTIICALIADCFCDSNHLIVRTWIEFCFMLLSVKDKSSINFFRVFSLFCLLQCIAFPILSILLHWTHPFISGILPFFFFPQHELCRVNWQVHANTEVVGCIPFGEILFYSAG